MLVTLTELEGVPLFCNVAMPLRNRGWSCSSWCSEGESSLNRGQCGIYKKYILNQQHKMQFTEHFYFHKHYHKISCYYTPHSHGIGTAYFNRIDFPLYNAAIFCLFFISIDFYLFNVQLIDGDILGFFFFNSLVKELSLPCVVVGEIPQGNGCRAPHLFRCRHQQFT